jgi:hypothetical protein
MKIQSTIGWNKEWLRKVVAYCCRALGYNPANVNTAFFSLAHSRLYRGWAYLLDHNIRVQINPLARYPVEAAKQRGLAELLHHDPVELLIKITAHELAHLARWDRFGRGWRRIGKRDTNLERDTERLARMVLADFRENREKLLASWGDPGPGPTPPTVIHQLTCKQCGKVWRQARRPRDCRRRSCKTCFSSWYKAARRGEFLVYERVENEAVGDVERR